MTAETLLRKVKRAIRNHTGASFSHDQICELVDLGIMDMLSAVANEATKVEARARLDARGAEHQRERSEERCQSDRNWIAALTSGA